MKLTRRAALAAPALLLAVRAEAQGGFPNRAVRMIVPYTPGGVSDITARLIAEPLAGTPGAERMGDAYFGIYLWAMGSGRPRTAEELAERLQRAGFMRPVERRTRVPLQTRVLVARRP